MNAEDGQLLDWQVGGRGARDFQPLFSRLKARYRPALYCSDAYRVYGKCVPAARLAQSKAVTTRSESDNANCRHYLGRLRRRTRIVSRSAAAVDLALRLYAWRTLDGLGQKLSGCYNST